jgi:hypothetical protein
MPVRFIKALEKLVLSDVETLADGLEMRQLQNHQLQGEMPLREYVLLKSRGFNVSNLKPVVDSLYEAKILVTYRKVSLYEVLSFINIVDKPQPSRQEMMANFLKQPLMVNYGSRNKFIPQLKEFLLPRVIKKFFFTMAGFAYAMKNSLKSKKHPEKELKETAPKLEEIPEKVPLQLTARSGEAIGKKIEIPFQPQERLYHINEVLNTINDQSFTSFCGLFTLLPYIDMTQNDIDQAKMCFSGYGLTLPLQKKYLSLIISRLKDLYLKTPSKWRDKGGGEYYVPDLLDLIEFHQKVKGKPNLVFISEEPMFIKGDTDVTLLIYGTHVELWTGQSIYNDLIPTTVMKSYVSNLAYY